MLYCQECGNEITVIEDAATDRPLFVRCSACGCLHKQGGMSRDEWFAWLMFPPDNAAA